MANTYNIKVTGTLDTSKIQEALKGVEQKYGTVKIGTGAASGIKGIGVAAKESKGMLGEFTSQLTNLSSTIPKVAAFGVATMAVNAFRDAIADGVQAVFDMDAALTEFRKVSDIGGEELDKYIDKATELGTTVARTGKEMIEAATTFKKSGFSEEDSLQLAEISSKYQNIADTQVSAAESASFLISQMKAFNISASDSVSIIDKVNEVANNMSLGTNDLSKAMEVAGAGLVTYGNDINDMISLVTAGTEIMVGRSQQVARGLNMIASRIVKNEGALKEYGISIYNANGSLRSTYDILADLAPKWKTMGDAQRVALGDTLAGTNQYKVLAAVMGNFDSALKAHEIALNSAGSASRENERAIDSLAGHLNQLKAQFEALANNVISSQFIKSILDAGAGILKFANSDIGQAIIKMTALALTFKMLVPLANKGITQLISLIGGGLSKVIDTVVASLMSMSYGIDVVGLGAEKLANAILSINPATLILTGIALATIVEKTFSAEAQFDRLNQKFEQSKTELESLQSEYDSLNTKSDLTPSEEARLRLLQSQLQTLKEQTAEYAKQAAQAYSQTGVTVTGGLDGVGGGLGTGAVEVETAGERAKKALEDWSNATKEAKEAANEYAELLYEEKDALDAVGEQLDEEAQAFLDAYEQVVPVIDDSQASLDNIANSIENYSDRVYALIDAQNELDATHQISQQTAENLLALYPELEGQITHLADGYYIEDEALRNLMQSELTQSGSVTDQIYASVKTLLSSEQAKAIAYNGTTKSLKNQIAAQIEYIKATQATMRLQLEAYRGTPQFAAASAAATRALAQSSSEMSKLQAAYSNVSALESVTDNLTSSVQRYAGSVASSGGATKSATSATKSNTKATKENTDAQEKAKKAHDELVNSLKDVADAYKTAAKYMSSQIDNEINALEKRKDAIEESYDAQIKAIQDANDAIEEQMELEKAQQALAEAKKKRQLVYTGGQFQYVEDAKAIAEAQENLNNIVRQQEMEKQVESLENARDAEIKAIDDQIAGWEKYKEQWESLADSYEEAQDKLIAQQVLGIKLEGDNWQKRLTNAQAFVDQYKKIMAQLDVLEGSETSTPKSAQTVLNQAKTLGTKGFANGTTSTPAGIYKVGEAGTELMVGRGNGVIPHNLTENLMKLGQFSPSEWVNSMRGVFADRNQTVVQQFGDISLPNVSNASQFVEQLKQFKNYAVQATSRR